MSSAKAETYDMIFKVRVASFYDLTPSSRKKILMDFQEFIKAKGVEQNFLVWRISMDTATEELTRRKARDE